MNQMNDYQDGAKSPGPCGYCKKVVPTTLKSETLSMCEGLEEVENVLVRVCDECGNMVSIPARSLPPIHQARRKIIESGMAPDSGGMTTELKSKVDARKNSNNKTERDYPQEYPLVAAAG